MRVLIKNLKKKKKKTAHLTEKNMLIQILSCTNSALLTEKISGCKFYHYNRNLPLKEQKYQVQTTFIMFKKRTVHRKNKLMQVLLCTYIAPLKEKKIRGYRFYYVQLRHYSQKIKISG